MMKHLKKTWAVLAFMFCGLNAHAQLTVTDFHADNSDLSAVQESVPDLNGDPTALVKVGLTAKGAEFEGNVVKAEQKGNEYWVYLVNGSTWLNIKTPDFTPLRYEFAAVQANTTYIMTVNKPGEEVRLPKIHVTLPAGASISGIATKTPPEFDMILVKAGMFQMGATPEQVGADDDESPVTWVHINHDFYVGETEVTQALWDYVMDSNPSTFQDPNKPVENITWIEARQFIEKLNNMVKGAQFKLPTEAEWEYVARGGHLAKHTLYAGGDNPDEVGWYYNNASNSTHPVKQLKPNELGVYDLSGNVWEMCQDYKGKYRGNPHTNPAINPVGTDKNKNHVRRGGSWVSQDPTEMRCAFRRRVEETMKDSSIGLRLVLVP